MGKVEGVGKVGGVGKVEMWIYHKIRIIGINVGLNQCQIRLISFLNSLSKKQRHRDWDWDGNGTGTRTLSLSIITQKEALKKIPCSMFKACILEEEYGDRQEKRIYHCNNCFILEPSINDLGMRLTSERTYLKFCHTGLRLLWHKHNNKRFSLFLGRCPVIYIMNRKWRGQRGEGVVGEKEG